MSFDFSLIWNSLPLLLAGAGVTIEITAIAVGLGFIFGLITSVCRLSGVKILQVIAVCYVNIIRGTPMLVQIFLIYFALPMVIGERINPFVAAVAACSINSGAYVSEIFRAGIQSVRYVIMPQAFKHVIPPLGNEFISMTKETSLVSVIGFEELTRRGQLIIAKTYGSFEIWLTVAAIYLVMTLTIARLVSYLERRFATDDRN